MSAKRKKIKTNQAIHGFLVKKVTLLRELDIRYYELEHIKTGARYIHLENRDKENTFLVAFKTIPTDSSGVAHILEHSVLAGSKKYSVRDPFFSMNKRSLKTFMNAFTSDDWTGYPFSTQNKKDFYNLMSVYLDAVFYPTLSELTFKQEGVRLEFLGNSLAYKGVVYNEMKGAMSSPERIMSDSLNKSLHPKSNYKFNAGGDPAVIPDLTHNQLKDFHRRFYHPSNAFFYSYGNFSLVEHLKFIEKNILDKFERLNLKNEIPNEPRWKSLKELTFHYPAPLEKDINNKFQACLAWLTAPVTEFFEVLSLELIEDILLGNPASPLRKALIDSGLGSDLSDETGLNIEHKETMFVCGLKDIKKKDVLKVKEVILSALKNLFNNGIDKDLVSSSLHKLEINRSEITNYPYPYGLKLFLDFSESWVHVGDPVSFLRYKKGIREIRSQITRNNFFEKQIKKYFLDNNNQVFLVLEPDKKMHEKEEIRLKKELSDISKKMSIEEKKKTEDDSKLLRKLQDSEEDLSCLPKIEIREISPKIIETEISCSKKDRAVMNFKQPTNGIFYFSAAFKVDNLEDDLVSLLPIFCYIFTKLGTKNKNYIDLARSIDTYTGGIYLSLKASTIQDKFRKNGSFVFLNAKCLERNYKKTFVLLSELIKEFNFSDRSAFKNFLFEYRARLESMIIEDGHRFALMLASSGLSYPSKLNENWYGIHQLLTTRNLVANLSDKNIDYLFNRFELIAEILFSASNIKIALIGDKDIISRSSELALGLKEKLPFVDKKYRRESFGESRLALAFVIPSTVSFTACSFKTVYLGHEDAPALYIASKIVANKYLHREIREKGGAYGGFVRYSVEEGIFSFLSYRDPHILETLNAYSGAMSYIKSGDYSEEDIEEAILQACSEIDKPDSPAETARAAFFRNLISLSDKKRQDFKKKLLKVKKQDIIRASKHFKKSWQECSVAVLSSKEKIEETNKKIGKKKLRILNGT